MQKPASLLFPALLSLTTLTTLIACDNHNTNTDSTNQNDSTTSSTKHQADTNIDTDKVVDNNSDQSGQSQPNSQADTDSIQIDWSQVDSGVTAIDPANFDYPFALDSQSVSSYAQFFDVDPQTARHNLTIGMASNEALSIVLDQLENNYISHKLTDGKDMTLIITTTPKVASGHYDYVIADKFARGLVLPIKIQSAEKEDKNSDNAN